jgi:hypothetical protein
MAFLIFSTSTGDRPSILSGFGFFGFGGFFARAI